MLTHYDQKPNQRVYFAKPIGMDGPIKIGCSTMPTTRLLTLMSWCPFPLELLAVIKGGYRMEADIHDCFAEAHRHNEWFDPSPDLVRAIERLKAGEPVEAVIPLGTKQGAMSAQRHRVNRHSRTPETRRKMSYSLRMSHVSRRLYKDNMCAPEDVALIMDAWTSYRNPERRIPTPEEFARLDEFLASPKDHAVPQHIRWPQHYPPPTSQEVA
jgi:hypothetical protein